MKTHSRAMAEENLSRLQDEPVSRSELTGMVQTLQAQLDQQTANLHAQMEQQTVNFQSQMSHLEDMMARQFGSGGNSKSPVHHYNLRQPPFNGGEFFFSREH